MNYFKHLLITSILLASVSTPLLADEDMTTYSAVGTLAVGATISAAEASGIPGLVLLTAGGVFSLLHIHDRIPAQEVEQGLLELAVNGETDSSIINNLIFQIREATEQVDNNFDTDIEHMSDQEIAKFLLTPQGR